MPDKTTPSAVKVRILTTCALGQANAVIEMPTDEAAAAVIAGLADATPEAVAYAETLTA